MKTGYGGSVRRDLGRLFEGQSIVGLTEEQLLDRFVERRDEPAFSALVSRHGPMVLGVCKRLLADPHDVEDAFQATFLVFIRKAGSIRDRDRLAPWLFGVARKVAAKTRTDAAKRRARESSGIEFQLASREKPVDVDLNRALFEEIDRLPASLREPILLCCVEGLTYDEAADRMRSTAPAIRGRLSRGRERLRERLARRGYAPASLGVAALLSEGAAPLAVPSAWLTTTTIQLARGGAFSAGVEFLAEGAIQTMIVTQTKFLLTAVLACGVAGSGIGAYAQRVADKPSADAKPTPVTDARPETVSVVNFDVTEPDEPEISETRPATPDQTDSDRLEKLEKKLDRLIQVLESQADSDRPRATATRRAPARAVDQGVFEPTKVNVAHQPPARDVEVDDSKPTRPNVARRTTSRTAASAGDAPPAAVSIPASPAEPRPPAPPVAPPSVLAPAVDDGQAMVKTVEGRTFVMRRTQNGDDVLQEKVEAGPDGNKVITRTISSNDSKRFEQLEKRVAELQERVSQMEKQIRDMKSSDKAKK